MSEEDSEKQFDATEQKLRKAREKGDFPRSTEVNAALAYLGSVAAGAVAMNWAVPIWTNSAALLWHEIGTSRHDSADLAEWDAATVTWRLASLIVLGLATIPATVILMGLIVQRGLVFVPSKLALDISRINPVKNAKQKFGRTGLVNFAISAGKASAVGIGGWLLFRDMLPVLTVAYDDTAWVAALRVVLWRAFLLAVSISVVFALFDLFWKHHDFHRRNRMSLKELKDEMKESEGDPYMKAARRQKSVDIVMSSMLADVETADVVIVNPTHYAVALQWKRGSGRAPVCVAKGVDDIALRIRERANDHKVPIWPDPPSARAIHASVRLGDEIMRDHFAAVAAAIRFAEAMREKARQGW
ncbi:flagellar type III secretion system protein FlhB [Paracoccus aerodenitrificans]|uniref:flagellar type III secretion system protein FlhB n=1 Tax=Paracoccus aerodenitrificans TaxID=3017781 RepID=UPI0022F02D24|nr:flagellar type III secretion system protein FlhB [Paracoccus aerodenitrificans]WBU63961.1 flagellar type III secretion system protein FlhB [Paracoccus aerodenitrificans]